MNPQYLPPQFANPNQGFQPTKQGLGAPPTGPTDTYATQHPPGGLMQQQMPPQFKNIPQMQPNPPLAQYSQPGQLGPTTPHLGQPQLNSNLNQARPQPQSVFHPSMQPPPTQIQNGPSLGPPLPNNPPKQMTPPPGSLGPPPLGPPGPMASPLQNSVPPVQMKSPAGPFPPPPRPQEPTGPGSGQSRLPPGPNPVGYPSNQMAPPPMNPASHVRPQESTGLGQSRFPPGPNPVGYPPQPMNQASPIQANSPPPTILTGTGSQIPPGVNKPVANQYPQKPPGPGPVSYQGMPPPPLPNQNAPLNLNPNTNQMYNQPPLPPPVGFNNPNHLANQMSDMHINNRQQPYPGSPAMNGDNYPHMPPPLNQNQNQNQNQSQGQQYMNGAGVQNRIPPPPGGPGAGYPPMPGQQPMPSMPGQPPMPGQQQMPSGPYPGQMPYQQPQQPARRLDPDQMPSPIQVTLDDQRTRSGIFCTNQKGLVPPLVSTNFITQDQGNASPRYIRSTMYSVPTTTDMMKQTAVPFGLVISPMARILDQEYPPPIVNLGEMGPVRCIRCKAYMSPFMQFIDAGRRFQCLFCKATTEVPADYFQHLDHTGQRVDRYERPEFILGTYEFIATKDYCRNNTFPKAPAIIFVIDVSYNNIKSGLVHLLCAEMKEILKHLPIDQGQDKSNMKVGFITYNNTVHFYNIKGTLAQPQMMVVGDTQEMFMPLLDGFLCDIEDSSPVIDSLMTQIPAMFADTRETETVLLPAIQAGLEALKASECAGKLIVFHSTLPTAEAPGRLKNRDERKLLGTEKERTVLTPQIQAFNQLGQDCVAAGCSVDLFVTNNSYIDLATIGQVCKLSGGEIFKYTYFQADVDGQRLINDIITDISRPIAFDSIMRVRTSTGVRPTDFYGHFYMSNTTDMEIAAIDCDKAVAIEIKHDDKLTEEDGVYIQVALLYTSCSGQRRLRIINLSLKTCSQMADLYRSCELDTIVNFFAKQSIYRLLENNPKTVKDSLVNRCAQMLACYRKNCASPSSAGQLILPECMKLLPLYVNCLLKSDALSGGSDMTVDDRSFVMQCVTITDIPTSVVYFYPRLIPLHEIQNGNEASELPNAMRCTIAKMNDNGVYLLENGIHMLLWIGFNADPDWIQSVFGVPTAAQIDIDHIGLPELDNSLSVTIRNVIEQIRIERHRYMRLTLVRQRDKLESVFRHFLVEDSGQDGSSSYVDFLCHMHKEIRQLLS